MIEARIKELANSPDAKGARAYAKKMLGIQEELLELIDSLIATRQGIVSKIEIFKRFLAMNESGIKEIATTQHAHTTSTTEDEFARTSTRKAAKIILERTGRPMMSGEIADCLRAGGKNLGTKEVSTVSAAMKYGKGKGEFLVSKRNGKLFWRLPEWGRENDGVGLEIGG
jgi:hypothetical protein